MPQRMSGEMMRKLIAGLIGLGAGLLPLIGSMFPVPAAARAALLIACVPFLAAAAVYLILLRPREKGQIALCVAIGLCAAVFLLIFLPLAFHSVAASESLALWLFLCRLAMYVAFWVSCALAYKRAPLVGRVLLIAGAVLFAYGFGYASVDGLLPVSALGFLCRAGAWLLARTHHQMEGMS